MSPIFRSVHWRDVLKNIVQNFHIENIDPEKWINHWTSDAKKNLDTTRENFPTKKKDWLNIKRKINTLRGQIIAIFDENEEVENKKKETKEKCLKFVSFVL